MSGKNRAFALAVATAALVGLSAPVASAASFSGPNTSGFNNDSIANVSGNQLPIQACNNDIPVNAGVLAGQVPLSDITALLGLLNSGRSTSAVTRSCTQTPTQTDPTTTTTSSTSSDPAGSNNSGMDHSGMGDSSWKGSNDPAGDPASNNTSGFNNDSIINTSNNQLPIQLCNNDIPVNAGLGVVQVPVDGVSGVLGILNSGPVSSSVTRTCTQTPTQNNPSTTTSTSSSS
jgi:hypothetical protein